MSPDSTIAAGTQSQVAPELTIRAIMTGMLIGALLTPCNVYSGLKIGWSFNMSIAAGLLGAGLWRLSDQVAGTKPYGLLENNINQTTASSSASIIAGGLVAPIPALTLLTGQTFSWPVLAMWVFAVSTLGVFVAAGLRQQMIERDQLKFPAGLATAETMTQIHGVGREAGEKLRVLVAGAGVSAALKLISDLVVAIPRIALPGSLQGLSFKNLSFAFDPSLLMIGFGAMIGLRTGVSLLLGAIVAWGVFAPMAVNLEWAEADSADSVWFEPLVTWLLWPGVTLTVVSTLTSFGLSIFARRGGFKWPSFLGSDRPPLSLTTGFVAVSGLLTILSFALFGIGVLEALLAIALSFVLAVVAARVTGETGITPVGALGKVTQLTFGVVTPGNMASNLMTANITGGAAGQCADLMHDLKTGYVIGATPRFQIIAQFFGILTGSLVGSLVYLMLIPDPMAMLITAEWPAPAVATWKAVAEVLSIGLGGIPQGAVPFMAVAACLGVASAVIERYYFDAAGRYFPSAPAFGLAFVIPAWNSISLFIGALAAAILRKVAPDWSSKRTLTLAAGLVAGESLAGVGLAIYRLA